MPGFGGDAGGRAGVAPAVQAALVAGGDGAPAGVAHLGGGADAAVGAAVAKVDLLHLVDQVGLGQLGAVAEQLPQGGVEQREPIDALLEFVNICLLYTSDAADE